MPSFSNTLEQAIHAALALANSRRHELATLEHLLLALIDEPNAAKVMQACGVNLEKLKTTLVEFIDEELSTLETDVEGSEAGRIVVVNGVKIVGTTNLPALVGADASALYARNVLNFLALSLNLKTGEWKIARDDEIVQATLVCDAGQVVAKK